MLQEIMFVFGFFMVRVGFPLLFLLFIGSMVERAYRKNQETKSEKAVETVTH